MIRLLGFIVSLLIATSASALSGWFSRADCTGNVVTSLTTGTAYFCADSAAVLNSFSSVLGTRGFVLYVTRTGDRSQTSAGIGEVRVYETQADPGSTVIVSTGLDQRGADVDADGIEDTLSLNGAPNRGAINEFTANALVLQITVLPAVSETMVIAVTGIR